MDASLPPSAVASSILSLPEPPITVARAPSGVVALKWLSPELALASMLASFAMPSRLSMVTAPAPEIVTDSSVPDAPVGTPAALNFRTPSESLAFAATSSVLTALEFRSTQESPATVSVMFSAEPVPAMHSLPSTSLSPYSFTVTARSSGIGLSSAVLELFSTRTVAGVLCRCTISMASDLTSRVGPPPEGSPGVPGT